MTQGNPHACAWLTCSAHPQSQSLHMHASVPHHLGRRPPHPCVQLTCSTQSQSPPMHAHHSPSWPTPPARRRRMRRAAGRPSHRCWMAAGVAGTAGRGPRGRRGPSARPGRCGGAGHCKGGGVALGVMVGGGEGGWRGKWCACNVARSCRRDVVTVHYVPHGHKTLHE